MVIMHAHVYAYVPFVSFDYVLSRLACLCFVWMDITFAHRFCVCVCVMYVYDMLMHVHVYL